MNYSENYNFALPEDEDVYDISPLNENFETLDNVLSESFEALDNVLNENFESLNGILNENESTLDEINEKIGTPTQSGQTLFSMLANNDTTRLTAIKSIQHYTYDLTSVSTKSYSINSVDPTKCIVLFERLYDANNFWVKVMYELKTNSVEFTCGKADDIIVVGLWIIEFC